MSLTVRLDVKQSQGLVMTPQLQQAIKLLQLSNLDLAAYVDRELQDNPFLEAAETGEAGEAQAAAPADANGAVEGALDGKPALDGAPDAAAEHVWSDTGADAPAPVSGEPPLSVTASPLPDRSGRFDDEPDDLMARLSRAPSLRERLHEQVHVTFPPGEDRAIAVALVEALDDHGYLRVGLDEIAADLLCPVERVEAALTRCQGFEPTGLFARSLAECLALQLAERDRLDPIMRRLLDNLPMLASGDHAALARRCGVDREELIEMVEELRALDPRPGSDPEAGSSPPVIPDITVRATPDGGWRIELNAATLPRLIVNADYHAKLSANGASRQAREYVAERFQSANWLVKALDQRARTLLRVTEAMVERQRGFLEHGVTRLKPLVLRDIAEATGLHESTVSRATAGKHIATPRGTYPYRFFFSTGLPATGGEVTHSSEAIRQRIKGIVAAEGASVLSDDQIVNRLRGEGIAIARRTVAKYREALGIPSSVARRKQKALHA